jgi:ankyrin repeat protein
MKTRLLVALLGMVSAIDGLAQSRRSPGDDFVIAIERADLAAVKALVEGGQAPDTPITSGSEYRTTPLIKAAGAGRTEIVRYLLSRGADVNGRGFEGTALIAAVGRGFDDVVEVLLKAGADIKATTDQGSTAFHAAVFAGHLDVAEQLLKAGGEVDAKDKHGFTPLVSAASVCNPEALRFLASNGARIDAIGQLEYGGSTALTTASRTGQVDCVRTLLELGANPALKMKDGATALSNAEQSGNADVLALIKEALAKAPARKSAKATGKP